MMGTRSAAPLVTVGLLLLVRAEAQWAPVELHIVSTAPARPHYVAAGAATTFVISLRNTADTPVTVRLAIERPAQAGWKARLFAADAVFRAVGDGADEATHTLAGGASVHVVAWLGASASLSDGEEGRAFVRAFAQGHEQGRVELPARVSRRPKLYYVAIDGCGPRYLDLNRRGTHFDGTGERLMPRSWAFAATAARMTRAAALLPAVTDPNHAAALTGAWGGTLGVYQVRRQYVGLNRFGQPASGFVSRESLRFGPDGERVVSLLDAAKDPAYGGAPTAFTAIVTGKDWLTDLFRDQALDLGVHGSDHPFYVPRPRPYRLGDPPSDEDAGRDREGTNLGPRRTRKLVSVEARIIQSAPWDFPEDRWVAEAAIRVIQAEDPDVVYVDLADADPAQHVFGAADEPGEWIDPGTPNVLWDDQNVYNSNANRDPVLDVLHEADHDFGAITDVLAARQALDRSFVVLLSDHRHVTALNAPGSLIDPGRILLEGGIVEADIERIVNRGQLGHIALTDPAKGRRVESLLESYEAFDPVQRRMVRPIMVVNRQEMDSGVDGGEGLIAQDGVAGDRRGELYSEWSIDAPRSEEPRVRWPDLFLFLRGHFVTRITSNLVSRDGHEVPINGVHGAPSSAELLLVASGPGIRPGAYAGPATPADLGATLFRLLGVDRPRSVDGRVLEEILVR